MHWGKMMSLVQIAAGFYNWSLLVFNIGTSVREVWSSDQANAMSRKSVFVYSHWGGFGDEDILVQLKNTSMFPEVSLLVDHTAFIPLYVGCFSDEKRHGNWGDFKSEWWWGWGEGGRENVHIEEVERSCNVELGCRVWYLRHLQSSSRFLRSHGLSVSSSIIFPGHGRLPEMPVWDQGWLQRGKRLCGGVGGMQS